jgi:hypothetical protein
VWGNGAPAGSLGESAALPMRRAFASMARPDAPVRRGQSLSLGVGGSSATADLRPRPRRSTPAELASLRRASFGQPIPETTTPDGPLWSVGARHGDADGRVWRKSFDRESAARALADRMMERNGGRKVWLDMTSLVHDSPRRARAADQAASLAMGPWAVAVRPMSVMSRSLHRNEQSQDKRSDGAAQDEYQRGQADDHGQHPSRGGAAWMPSSPMTASKARSCAEGGRPPT